MIHTNYLSGVFDKEIFAKRIAAAKKQLKKVEFDAFAVSGNSGTLMGGALALAMKKRVILVRKKTDKSHSSHIVEGDDSCSSYIFLDDCMCSGETQTRVKNEIGGTFKKCRYVGTYLYNDDHWRPKQQ